MPIFYTFVNGKFVLISVRHNRKLVSLFLQALSIWAHTNDVRRILSVFFHGI